MKKICFAILTAICFASCNDNAKTNNTTAPLDSTKTDTAVKRTTVPTDSGYREGGSYH